MSKKDEALKLALEALSPWAGEDANHTEQYAAYHAIREALAEQETVLPGGGHVPAVPVAVYGYCPECGGAGVMRERRPNGDDKCTNGHKYPSSKALAEQPAHQEPYGQVTVVRRPGCVDQHWFYRWPEPPYLDNAAECHTVYTSPPASKPWVGLTDGEWMNIVNKDHAWYGQRPDEVAHEVAKLVEAKLKEKNA